LSVNGVAPRVAQAAMRHSKLDLTMKVYTDDKLLDVAKAVAALPAIPRVGSPGTKKGDQFAPEFAPIPCNPMQTGAIPGNNQADDGLSKGFAGIVGSALPVNKKGPVTTPVNEPSGVGATGLEPVTPSVSFNPCRPAISAEKALISSRILAEGSAVASAKKGCK